MCIWNYLHYFALTVFPLHLSAPCKPRHVKAVMDCYTETAQVSWYPSDGALLYMVVATTASGHNDTCETNMTSCELEGLTCGQSYSVSVKSVGETCSSIAEMTGKLVTGEQHKSNCNYQILSKFKRFKYLTIFKKSACVVRLSFFIVCANLFNRVKKKYT